MGSSVLGGLSVGSHGVFSKFNSGEQISDLEIVDCVDDSIDFDDDSIDFDDDFSAYSMIFKNSSSDMGVGSRMFIGDAGLLPSGGFDISLRLEGCVP